MVCAAQFEHRAIINLRPRLEESCDHGLGEAMRSKSSGHCPREIVDHASDGA